MKHTLVLCLSLMFSASLAAQQNVIAKTDELGRHVSREYEWDSVPAHCIMAYIDNVSYNLDTLTRCAQVTAKYRYPDCPKCRLEKVNYRGVIVIPDSVSYDGQTYLVTSIASNAFRRCIHLHHVYMPNMVTEVGVHAFADCIHLREPVYNQRIFAYLPEFYEGEYRVPEGIEYIAGGAFANSRKLTAIILPNSVTKVAYNAFAGNSQLYEPVFNDHLFAYMPPSSFFGTSYTVPDGIRTIADGAFFLNDQLTTVILPQSVAEIGEYAFYGCSMLDTLVFPARLQSIGRGAFSHCAELKEVVIPEGVQRLPEDVFGTCDRLQSVAIPGSVKVIERDAFERCFSLTSIRLAEGIDSIASGAFIWGPRPLSLVIPASVTYLAPDAFAYGRIRDLTVHPDNRYYYMDNGLLCTRDHRLIACSKVKAATVPEEIVFIERNAFYYCDRIRLKVPKRFEGTFKTDYCKKVKYY